MFLPQVFKSKTPRLYWFVADWFPFAFRYKSLAEIKATRYDVYGIGWRRWVLYYHRKNAYGLGKPAHFQWCNYFGTGDGG